MRGEWVILNAEPNAATVVYYCTAAATSPGRPRCTARSPVLSAGVATLASLRSITGSLPSTAFRRQCTMRSPDIGGCWPRATRRVKIVIAGDSAGGGLALSTLLALRDARCAPARRRGDDRALGRSRRGARWSRNAASGASLTRTSATAPFDDPLASGLYADLHGLPPLMIQASTIEMLARRRGASRCQGARGRRRFDAAAVGRRSARLAYLLRPARIARSVRRDRGVRRPRDAALIASDRCVRQLDARRAAIAGLTRRFAGALSGYALALRRSAARRPHDLDRRRGGASEPFLHRRRQRRHLEERRCRTHVDADFRFAADRLDRRARGRAERSERRSTPAAARDCSAPILPVGDGIYKSTDAGATWTHLGLRDGRQIAAIAVDPKNADASVRCGARPSVRSERRARRLPLDSTAARRSRACSSRTKTSARSTSCSIRTISNIVYATLWAARQAPWEIGGSFEIPGSGIFKSTDGGTTWSQIDDGSAARIGRSEIAAAPSNPQIVYVVRRYAATTAGPSIAATMRARISRKPTATPQIAQRGDDLVSIAVDPHDANVVYLTNTSTYRSSDGGKTFVAIKGAPGGDDYHARLDRSRQLEHHRAR